MTIIIQLSNLGSRGIRIDGLGPFANLGRDVSAAGDFNGDGFGDFLLGGILNNMAPTGFGETFVLFGQAGASFGPIDLEALSLDQGFFIQGASAGDAAGEALSSAGDVNGDGIDDIIIGAPRAENLRGHAYVVFGRTSGFDSIDLASLSPADGFRIRGLESNWTGSGVSAAGDINNDGFDDVIVGAPDNDAGGANTGRAYVIFGKADGFATIDLAQFSASDGFILQGANANDFLGSSISSLGDINGDGFDDIILGSNQNDGTGYLAGTAYVIYGKAGGFGTIDLEILTEEQGFILRGGPGDQAGYGVSAAGDVNGDGFEDILVGTHADGVGAAYVVFGKAGGFDTIDLPTLAPADGFRIRGATDDSATGLSVSSAGDVNGDGFDDVIVGAPFGAPDQVGRAYVIFGKASGFGPIDLNALADADGYVIEGVSHYDFTGRRVSSAGDVNGDGFDEILVSASGSDAGGYGAGAVYMIFGIVPEDDVTRTGTIAGQTLAGGAEDDVLNGLGGDDRLFGNAGTDALDGGDGDDQLFGGAGDDTVLGGDGNDTATTFGGTTSADTGQDVVSLGAGHDHLIVDFSDLTEAVTFATPPSYGQEGAAGLIRVDGDDRLTFHDIERLTITTGSANDIVYAVGDEDRVSTRSGNDTIYSDLAAGRDRIDGGAGVDTAVQVDWSDLGGDQAVILDLNDVGGVTVGAGATERYLRGVEQLLNFYSGDGADIIRLNVDASLRNAVYTGDGDDIVTVYGGATDTATAALSVVEMGLGANRLIVDYGAATEAVTYESPPLFDGFGSSGRIRIDGVATLDFGGVDGITLTTGSADDVVHGLRGDDILSTAGGLDLLYGGAGDDELRGGGGGDRMEGGADEDSYFVDDAGDVVIELADEGQDAVFASVSYILTAGQHVEALSTGDAAATLAINLTGNGFGQTITGNAGANMLNGLAGADVMSGLGGNDIYYVDVAADQVVETSSNGGTDVVYASTSYALAADHYVEILSTNSHAGTAALNLGGNNRVNSLIGNAGANSLNGGGGADAMNGLGGNDSYFVDNVGDQIVEAAGGGNDTLYTSVSYVLAANVSVEYLSTSAQAGTLAINLTGNNIANILFGNDGANILNGAAGSDMLIGFGGNDSYMIDVATDQIVEAAGGGNDTVFASFSYALTFDQEVEYLSTSSQAGTAAINLTGNNLSNTIFGNNGANALNGLTGIDYMQGFGGNDSYFVDIFGDRVFEAAGGGTDTLYASASYVLAAYESVETMSTTSQGATHAIDLTGNNIANTIFGNDGANVLNGGGGNDTLLGFGGADTFAFTTAIGAGNVDTIGGFSALDDTIALEDAVFGGIGGLGALGANAFVTGTAAQDADDRIVYNAATGQLFFDADGNGATAQILFARIGAGLALAASDFVVI